MLLLLVMGCSQTISGNGDSAPDASVSNQFPDAAPLPDAAPADAAPQAQPCVEGDSNSEDTATGTCYMLFNATLDRSAALAACLGVGASLVAIESDAEQAIVGVLSGNFPNGQPDLWIGATDVAQENVYLWADGSPVVFENFRDGEPNNGNGNGPENCLVIEGDTGTKTWDDRPCGTPFPYICER